MAKSTQGNYRVWADPEQQEKMARARPNLNWNLETDMVIENSRADTFLTQRSPSYPRLLVEAGAARSFWTTQRDALILQDSTCRPVD